MSSVESLATIVNSAPESDRRNNSSENNRRQESSELDDAILNEEGNHEQLSDNYESLGRMRRIDSSLAQSPVAPLSHRQGHLLWIDLDTDEAFPKDARPPPPPDFPLHRAVFQNDPRTVAKLLHTGRVLVAQKDIHGNTPLHLSLAMGHKECTKILLSHHAPVKIKNKNGWTPMHEAISYGDRETKMRWEFKSWGMTELVPASNLDLADIHCIPVPFLSSMLPSDVCKIYKKRGNIRMDTTLIYFNEENWERGDISFIFRSDDGPDESLIILDNIARVYQKVRSQEADFEIEHEVDVVMSSDIVNAKVSMATINFRRAKTGWWIFQQDRTEQVGKYPADVYSVDGLYLENRLRREHLSSDDVKQNRKIIENIRLGTLSRDEEWRRLHTMIKRKSLPMPPATSAAWDDYISATPGHYPRLGRPVILKEWIRLYKANVAMTNEFPLSIDNLLDVLEIVAPFKHLNRLRLFCQIKLPPGFPVQIEIPLLPTVSAKITFQKIKFSRDITDTMFTVPKSYCEESGHFPSL